MNVVALAGGTGGAKLAHGLQAALAPGELTVVVNTGDDTERHGLLVMPDHDAVMYMLAGRFDDERGWGIAGETWTVMDALADYGEEAWFRLGDRDFATHIARTSRLRAGSDLTAVVRSLQTALGIATPILPMADAPVRTEVRVDEGWLDFQEYFVHRHQAPEVREVRFRGDLTPSAAVIGAIAAADVIVIGPSNPIVSIGPILAGPIRDLVAARAAAGVPVVAVSPIVGGAALKGPADRMLVSLGHEFERPGSGPDLPRARDGVRARHGRRLARAGHRGARLPDARHRHRHGRPRRTCPARPDRPRLRGGGDAGRHAMSRVAAIIPVGTLEGAKTRLGEMLDAEERRDLVERLLARTVVAALDVTSLGDVLVVSPDREVLRHASAIGARTLLQRSDGLNHGLREARADVVAGGATAILVIPVDLPLITTEAIEAVATPLTDEPDAQGTLVVIVSDRHGTGTNALGLRPPDVIDFAFGRGSRQAHLAAAATAGATLIELDGPLTVDLDTPDDLVFVESAEVERTGGLGVR